MSALSLSAVGGFERKGGITFSADFLVAVVFFGNCSDGWVHHTSSQPEHEVQGRLFLDVIV